MPDSQQPTHLPSPVLSSVQIDRIARRRRAVIGERNEFALLDNTAQTLSLLDGGYVQVATDVTVAEAISAEGMGLSGPMTLTVRGEGRVQVEVLARQPNGHVEPLESRSAQLTDGALRLPLFAVLGRHASRLSEAHLLFALVSRGDATISGVEVSDDSGEARGRLARLALSEETVSRFPIRAQLMGTNHPLDRETGELILPEATSVDVDTGFTLTRRFLQDRAEGTAPLALLLAGQGRVMAQVWLTTGAFGDRVLLYEDQIALTDPAHRAAIDTGASDILTSGFETGALFVRVTAMEDSRVTDISLDGATETAARTPTVLQNIVFADPKICNEPHLFVHTNDRAFTRMGHPGVTMLKAGVAVFDTYFNLLNLGNWYRHCALEDLELVLQGTGGVSLHVWMAAPAGFDNVIAFDDIVELKPEGISVDLSALLSEKMLQASGGVVMFKMTAIEDAELTGGAFRTHSPDQRTPKLAISITTFKREEDVAEAAEKLAAFSEAFEGGDKVHTFIVDNGQTAEVLSHPNVTYVPNPNLGGAGGFARGLAEATAAGYTHCLFMDDDATFLAESFVRAYGYLRFARDPKAALSGAMISNARKWAMWENGAVFDQHCKPQFVGTDLRHPAHVLEMEFKSAQPKPAQFYGGWWFFAFPIDQVKQHPFPFFVRGDDINFSLANKFSFATMSGVVSFQDDFSAKESALNLYLDVRNHIVHHLVFPDMELGALGTASIPLRFIARSLVRLHYESAEAKLQAWEDVMEGPDFFAKNSDMAERRKSIGATIQIEKWRPMDLTDVPPERHESPYSDAKQRLFSRTLNGHFLPFLGRDKISIPVELRGLLFPLWGATEITFTNRAAGAGYTVKMDRARAMRILMRAAKLTLRFRRTYPALLRSYRKGYDRIATPDFWQDQFNPSDQGTTDKAA